MKKKSLVITSIANDQHPVLKKFAEDCGKRNIDFILIGDTKSPAEFKMDQCNCAAIKEI